MEFLSVLLSAILGGGVSVALYKLTERKEKAMKTISELHELIRLAKEIAFTSTDLLSELKVMDKKAIDKARNFSGHQIHEFVINAPANAIYIDEEVYNRTVTFIDFLMNKSDSLGEEMKPEDFVKEVYCTLDEVSEEGYDYLSFLLEKRSNLLIEFGDKYIK